MSEIFHEVHFGDAAGMADYSVLSLFTFYYIKLEKNMEILPDISQADCGIRAGYKSGN